MNTCNDCLYFHNNEKNNSPECREPTMGSGKINYVTGEYFLPVVYQVRKNSHTCSRYKHVTEFISCNTCVYYNKEKSSYASAQCCYPSNCGLAEESISKEMTIVFYTPAEFRNKSGRNFCGITAKYYVRDPDK